MKETDIFEQGYLVGYHPPSKDRLIAITLGSDINPYLPKGVYDREGYPIAEIWDMGFNLGQDDYYFDAGLIPPWMKTFDPIV